VDTPETFGKKIKELRIKAKLSQRELADRVAKHLGGFDFTYLSKIENDRMDPPSVPAILAITEELNRAAPELNVNSDELLALAGKSPPDIGQLFRRSQGARTFFRSAVSTDLSEDDWKEFLRRIDEKKKQ
jgi:transcriptional regulator with XRE-family HTH domain